MINNVSIMPNEINKYTEMVLCCLNMQITI